MYAEKYGNNDVGKYTFSILQKMDAEKYGNDDVGKYTFSILQKMYADPPVIEHFGMETKQGGETLSFNV